jgi:hypothetical protein
MKDGTLVRLDPASFRPLPRKSIELGKYGYSWSFSPDGSKLVLGGFAAGLRLVDVQRMRVLSDLKVAPAGLVVAVAWPDSRHVHAVVQAPSGQGKLNLAIIDAVTKRVLAKRRLAGASDIVQVRRAGDGLVLLLAPPSRIGASRLVLVDGSGNVGSVTLSRIRAGWEPRQVGSELPISRQWTPGLAVDPVGRRAFVVTGGALVAEVDLRSLDVAYHRVSERVSLLSRLRNWLEPTAEAKGETQGPVREARWVGEGLVAVSGGDGHGEKGRSPMGLTVIDTADWTARKIDERASRFALAGGTLLAFAGQFNTGGFGVTAYHSDGERRWHLFGEEGIGRVQTAGERAYVDVSDGRGDRVVVLDLRSGRLIRRVETPWAQLLLPEDASLLEKYG